MRAPLAIAIGGAGVQEEDGDGGCYGNYAAAEPATGDHPVLSDSQAIFEELEELGKCWR
jgi:hypothetical protein